MNCYDFLVTKNIKIFLKPKTSSLKLFFDFAPCITFHCVFPEGQVSFLVMKKNKLRND